MAGHFGTKHNRTPVCKQCAAAPKYRAGLCREHYFARQRLRRAEKRRMRSLTCKHCGGAITNPSPWKAFCSRRCVTDARNLRERKHKILPTTTRCKQCHADFAPKAAWQKFCTEACVRADRNARLRKNRKAAMISGNCESCGQPFIKPRHLYVKRLIQRKPKFCSIACAYRARRGAASPKFRGGIITYRGVKWLDIAEQMRARDEYLCVACGALTKNRKHSVDHIIPFRLMTQWGLDPNQPENLMTMCGSCHCRKLTIEDRLIRGDVVGFLRGLVSIHYPIERIRAACAVAGLSMNGVGLERSA